SAANAADVSNAGPTIHGAAAGANARSNDDRRIAVADVSDRRTNSADLIGSVRRRLRHDAWYDGCRRLRCGLWWLWLRHGRWRCASWFHLRTDQSIRFDNWYNHDGHDRVTGSWPGIYSSCVLILAPKKILVEDAYQMMIGVFV